MIMRNREKFEVRRVANVKTSREQNSGVPQAASKAFRNKARNPKWSDAQFAIAITLWDEGKSLRYIGAKMGLSASTVQFMTSRNVDRFKPRKRHRTGRPAHGSVQKRDPMAKFIENQAESLYDFTRYQIEETKPVAFWQLSGCQCHFPLERFEAVSGPETPCCGQKSLDGSAYCNTHWQLMHKVRG